MGRFVAAVALVGLVLAGPACSKQGSPEVVADGFVEAYFRHMDQEKAKEYTALGATEMLEKELRDVDQIRRDGYSPGDAAPEVTVRRGAPVPRDQRIRFPYEVRITTDPGHEVVRDADIELAKIDGVWKVVRVGVKPRS